MIRISVFPTPALRHTVSADCSSLALADVRQALLAAAHDTGIYLQNWQCQTLNGSADEQARYLLQCSFTTPSARANLLMQRILTHSKQLDIRTVGLQTCLLATRQDKLTSAKLTAQARIQPAQAKTSNAPHLFMGSLLPKSYTDSLRQG